MSAGVDRFIGLGIVYSFHSLLCVLSQAKKLRIVVFANESSEHHTLYVNKIDPFRIATFHNFIFHHQQWHKVKQNRGKEVEIRYI